MKHIMIDIETFGTKNDSAIMSIGAVVFDKKTIYDNFLMNISSESNIAVGRKIYGATLDWWLTQAPEAIKSLSKPRPKDLPWTLIKFSDWMTSQKFKKVWANGASFDFGLLRDAFEMTNIKCPWHFREENCMRTIRTLGEELGIPYKVFKEQNNANVHSALDDAKCQASYVISVWNKISGVSSTAEQ